MIVAWLTLLSVLAPALPQTPPYRFTTAVDLVILNVSVRDGQGWFAADLDQSNFSIFEDGRPQAMHLFRREDVPVSVGLVVDHSGSMAPKLPEVIAAAQTFAAASRSDDDIFVVNFNDNVTLEKPHRPGDLARSLSSRPTAGKTALYDAVIQALDRLNVRSLPKKVLIVISDGGDNASRHTVRNVLTAIAETDVLVYTIGIFSEDDPDQNRDVLRHLAHVSGAEAFFPQKLSDVTSICERIARDIRSQYVIGYVSTNVPKPGAYRSIRLMVHAQGKGRLVARTRSGYLAAEKAK